MVDVKQLDDAQLERLALEVHPCTHCASADCGLARYVLRTFGYRPAGKVRGVQQWRKR